MDEKAGDDADGIALDSKGSNKEKLENEGGGEVFKKPNLCLVGPRRGKGVKIRAVTKDSSQNVDEDDKEETEFIAVKDVESMSSAHVESESSEEVKQPVVELNSPKPDNKPKALPQKLKEGPIPYIEPKWGGITDKSYSLEVVKSGVIIEPIDLTAKSFYVFGRQTNCDIQMAHPTVSRYHAVLQFCVGTDDKPAGFYIYDLGSTHGTFLNKNRIRPKMHIRVQVGHQVKIGCSSRLYLLQGPVDDMEEESELTVTELKAKRQRELQERELAEMERQRKEEAERERRENEGIDWGMGDDADEETDLAENPYASTNNEELYIDDPKKTLRGWFEREGHELDYDVEEKGPGQFLCRVEIPVEGSRGGSMVAEALVKGKKKEAVAQCALEACRLLDRCGLLRQATHESRKRKAKNWEEEDFYDSDDDTFLDRTGIVERKRQQRMQQAGKVEPQVETYESLLTKHTAKLEEIRVTDSQLSEALNNLKAAKAAKDEADPDGDTLDSFMSNLSTIVSADKKLVSKLRVDLAALQKEELQLRKLVNIARPATLPELVPPMSNSSNTFNNDKEALKNKLMINARKKTSEKQKVVSETVKSKQQAESDTAHKGEEEECDIIEDSLERHITHEKPKSGEGNSEEKQGHAEDQHSARKLPDHSKKSPTDPERRVIGPAKPDFLLQDTVKQEILSKCDETPGSSNEEDSCDIDEEQAKKEAERRKRKNRRRQLQRNEKALERTKADYDASDPNYSVWVPPEDQSGDGKTSLNEKLGY